MHWLQALDTSAFYFINRSLSNPLFDRLMPVFSGGPWFILLATVAAIVVLATGGARARICVLMLCVILGIGDGLVTNTVKHAVARPRPFVTLSDVRLYGKEVSVDGQASSAAGNRNSMPSSHAANCFAATMVVFFFYRRSLRITLPLACLVAFSRVYNGMHYPSDVLAGAIIGAGYAVALLVGFETAWNRLGRRWFPAWHAQMPSLLAAETKASGIENPQFEIEWLRLGYILIGVMLIGRWMYLAGHAIELSQDEAYQWTWSKHLDLSYYSKPPGIAVLPFLGTPLCGDTA